MSNFIVNPYRAAGGNDAYTVTLLHFDGSDASTTFTDSSVSAHTYSATGNAQLDTAQSKFGSASLLLDGAGDLISAAADADFIFTGSDWTVDFWMRPASVTGLHTMLHASPSGAAQGLHIYTNGSAVNVDNGAVASGISAGAVAIDTWYHIAVEKTGGTTYLYVDGALVDSEASQTYNSSNGIPRIGQFHSGAYSYNGHIDEFRISQDIARYGGSGFTPATGPYS